MQGDSGGQLMLEDKSLVGIVSWGKGCGLPDYPGKKKPIVILIELSDYLKFVFI